MTECELNKKEEKRLSVVKGKRTVKKKKGGSMINKKAKMGNDLIMEEIPERLIAPCAVKSKEKKKGRRKLAIRNKKMVKHHNEIEENSGCIIRDEQNMEGRHGRLNKNDEIRTIDEVVNVKNVKRKITIKEWLENENTEEIKKGKTERKKKMVKKRDQK